MRYSIQRECWSTNTYNGFEDSPYWLISFDNYQIGLKDNGRFWSVVNGVDVKSSHIKEKLNTIIKECKLNIILLG